MDTQPLMPNAQKPEGQPSVPQATPPASSTPIAPPIEPSVPHVDVHAQLAIESKDEPSSEDLRPAKEVSLLDKRNKILFIIGSIGALFFILATIGVGYLLTGSK